MSIETAWLNELEQRQRAEARVTSLKAALHGVLEWLKTEGCSCDCGTDDYANAAPCALCVARRVLS